MKTNEQRHFATVVRDALAAASTQEQRNQIVRSTAAAIAALPTERAQQAVVAVLQEELRREEGIITADVTSAHPLTDVVQQTLRTQLMHKYHATDVVIRSRIEPALIGGIRIRVGDEVFDGSIRASLREFSKQLHV